VMSADEEFGLVYLPTGNETPDFFGGNRIAASEKFASSIIAVDAKTGALRWSFQTTHHDIWDFDLPSQPVLVSINEAPNVPATPAIVVPTKQGHFYILDRRDGRPLTPIEERPVPQGAAAGDFTSPTQPFQTGLPNLGPPRLTEADMWGLTPMDQLWCRTQFRQLRYEGPYTPPSTQGSISYPGSVGVFEWGSVSVDPRTNRMFANTSWMPMVVTLIPRDRYEAMEAPELGLGGTGRGTPYAMQVLPLMSPLEMPCQAPPWGHLTAIDLNARNIAWRLPIGTSRTNGPLGIPTGVPMPAGVPNIGGSLVTGSGLLFIAATADDTFRAFDSASGKELWHDYLPTAGNATPMTYLGRDGRQYVVIAAGGHTGLSQTYGDALVAYALPNPGVK
jgi:quinoprotein glucose dehydrogenase